MKNSEKYKQAASRITPSANMNVMNYIEEKETKRMMKTPVLRRALAVCMSLLFAIGLGYTAYAADFGGIRRPIDLWLHGSMDEVTIEDAGDGQYHVTYSDGSVRSVGGFAYEGDAARDLTEDEIISLLLTQTEVEKDENGPIGCICGIIRSISQSPCSNRDMHRKRSRTAFWQTLLPSSCMMKTAGVS